MKLSQLEDDEEELLKAIRGRDEMHAVDDRGGLLSAAIPRSLSVLLSFFWVLHVILTVLVKPAAHPFLNSFFMCCIICGGCSGCQSSRCFALPRLLRHQGKHAPGAEILLIDLYPMKLGRTNMSSLLFNTFIMLARCP